MKRGTNLLRLWKKKTMLIGLIGVALLVLMSIFSGWITSSDPVVHGNLLTERYLSPSGDHPFGTDKFGRDVFSRVLYGGRISLTIAISVVVLAMTIGLFYGTVSGYLGGWLDASLMRFLDFLLAFPSIFLIITVVAVFGMSHWYLIPVLALTGWMETARIVRAEVLSVKERDFILAAVGLGLSRVRILARHIIPNCLTPVIVAATLKVGEVILIESALSFLGIGVQPPVPSWGNIINDGRDVLLRAWWISTFPGFFIVASVVSFSLLGDGIRSWLSPTER
jgi:peptide/nickel transport system permease protein